MLQTSDRTVQGIRCAVHEAGDRASAEAVVFVHGNPGPLDDWEFVAPATAAFARVIAMDLPGFGRTARAKTFAYSVDAYADFLDELLEQLHVRRVHLVAHDFGGAWGARWALNRPDALASLTLIDSPLCAEFRWHFWANVWNTPLLGELVQAGTWASLIKWVMNRDNPRPFPPEFVERVTRFADRAQKSAVLDIYRQCRNPAEVFGPLAEGLRHLDPPACLIWGSRDPYAGPLLAQKVQRSLPRAELHMIGNAGHWPFIDEPAQVRDILCTFLKRQVQRPHPLTEAPAR